MVVCTVLEERFIVLARGTGLQWVRNLPDTAGVFSLLPSCPILAEIKSLLRPSSIDLYIYSFLVERLA